MNIKENIERFPSSIFKDVFDIIVNNGPIKCNYDYYDNVKIKMFEADLRNIRRTPSNYQFVLMGMFPELDFVTQEDCKVFSYLDEASVIEKILKLK